MATHPHYPNLWEGPVVDGEQTWFCYGADVPLGSDRRYDFGGWSIGTREGQVTQKGIYQVKNVRLPDPEGWKQPDGEIIAVAMQLRNRTDLDDWLWLTADGDWKPVAGRPACWDGLFPIRIRRR